MSFAFIRRINICVKAKVFNINLKNIFESCLYGIFYEKVLYFKFGRMWEYESLYDGTNFTIGYDISGGLRDGDMNSYSGK